MIARTHRHLFIGLSTLTAVAACVVASGLGLAAANSASRGPAAATCGPSLADPADLQPGADGAYDLTAAATSFNLGGKTTTGETYNGSYVGPTLHLMPGQRATVKLTNRLDVPTNLHYHGLHVSPEGAQDNPFITVNPGETFTYTLDVPADQPPGTFWYHDHAMPMSGMSMSSAAWGADVESQIMAGLSGTIIVGDDRELLPAAFRNITTHTLVLKDLQSTKTGTPVQNVGASTINSNAPTVRTVNGQVQPTLTMCPGETQLWRLSNEGADIFYNLHAKGYTFTVVSQDGQPVRAVTTTGTLLLNPGKRYDVLVTASRMPSTTWLETLPYSNGPQGDSYPQDNLMKIAVKGAPVASLGAPTAPLAGSGDDLRSAPVATHRDVTLSEDSTGMHFMINGQPYTGDRSIFSTPAKLGDVEEWTLTNTSGETHPFHLHTDDFQVTAINGQPQPAIGWQDSVPVPNAENGKPGTVTIRIRFSDFVGKVMFHCHIAAHEDNGMMSFINVATR